MISGIKNSDEVATRLKKDYNADINAFDKIQQELLNMSQYFVDELVSQFTNWFNKYKFDAPIEAVLEFEQEDEWNGLPISTPPYTICAKCNFDKCVPIDYQSKRGFHHIYKDN